MENFKSNFKSVKTLVQKHGTLEDLSVISYLEKIIFPYCDRMEELFKGIYADIIEIDRSFEEDLAEWQGTDILEEIANEGIL